MNDNLHRALLPHGLRDLLPPDAAQEAEVVSRLVAVMASHGYERVKPPLAEYETNLLSGAGAAMAQETFRLMDPISQRMIGLRADMTPQIARIATTRLKNSERPLRLCYAGQVLRVMGSEIRPERQVGQVGAELIGSDDVAADVEVVAVAAEALSGLGINGLSVDLTLPTLVPAVLRALRIDNDAFEPLRTALDHKNTEAASVAVGGGRASELLGSLLAASGAADKALAALAELDLPAPATAERTRLEAVVAKLRQAMPDLALTVDPVENRGFEYHTGISFTFFARGVRGELGRGGRYRTGEAGEHATGFTLYTDTVLQAVPSQPPSRRLYLPAGAEPAVGRSLRAEGWVTVAGLGPARDMETEARRLGCFHRLDGDEIVPVA